MSAATLENVLTSPKLPSLPSVAVKLLELTRDPEVDLGDIAQIVQYEPALSAKILKTVNSSYYRLSQPCPTIKRALAYLGLSTVKSLVLGFSLVDLTRNCGARFDLLDYWRRCVYSAAAARRIAMVTGACDPDEAFIAALMQDVGMLAMHAALGPEYDEVIARTNGNHHMLPYCESDSLGFTHAEAGACMGERWCLPEEIVDPIRHHHQRGTTDGRHRSIINAVVLAYRVSNLVSTDNPKPILDMFSAMCQSLFHISEEDERSVLRAATEDAQALATLLEVRIGMLPDVTTILAEADEALTRHHMETRREAELLRQSGEAVARQAPSDGLAGVGDRDLFDHDLAEMFATAREQDGNLGLILVDADRFGSINNMLGREAGEMVLHAIARRLGKLVGGAGLVYRFGAEELAVVLPGASRGDAARTAERLRRAIERQHVDLERAAAEAVQVTASFGVATLEPDVTDRVTSPTVLIRLAEKAVRAAKAAGANRVRMFSPRPPSAAA